MKQPTSKPVESSRTTMTEFVLPTHANALGNVFGGQVLAWMDICAAICAHSASQPQSVRPTPPMAAARR